MFNYMSGELAQGYLSREVFGMLTGVVFVHSFCCIYQWGMNNMAEIFQKTFWNLFSWLKFPCGLFSIRYYPTTHKKQYKHVITATKIQDMEPLIALTLHPWTKWQTTITNAFSWMKMTEFRFEIFWNLFPGVELTISQHWSMWWLGVEQATSHYLKQCWPYSLTHICGMRGDRLVALCDWNPLVNGQEKPAMRWFLGFYIYS